MNDNLPRISKRRLQTEAKDDLTLKGSFRFKETGNVSSKACLISTDSKSGYDSEVYRLSKTVWKKPIGLLKFTAPSGSPWNTFNSLVEKASRAVSAFAMGLYADSKIVVSESNGTIVYSAAQPGISVTAAQVKAEIDRSVDFAKTREIRINLSGPMPRINTSIDFGDVYGRSIENGDNLDRLAFSVYGFSCNQHETDDAFRHRMISAWDNQGKSRSITYDSMQEVLEEMKSSVSQPIATFRVDLGKKKDL